MGNKEASARIKINKLLDESGWRFFDDENGKANIRLEPGVKYTELGDDFEHEIHGFIDFLLLDKDGKPLLVVEAKKESIDPLSAKEQARNYARNAGARFVILSNGNIHYFWDIKHGNPDTISRFPTQDSITQYKTYTPNPIELSNTIVDENYIVESQMPGFANDPSFKDELTKSAYLKSNNLKQLRKYQVEAVHALQISAKEGKQRFLFEMATGTGKTLVSSAVIKLFLKSGNAKRVLFLVDRLELEDQAYKSFVQQLGKDFHCIIYKNSRESWQNSSIVVSTIQTFLAGDHYKKNFSPTDFELVISDEAHRSIGGNSRSVFEYFVGYKLGLTATPKNYLNGFDQLNPNTQREYERRVLLDTYKTFGCEQGNPTYTYDLNRGSKEGYLIQPIVVDARTEITTQLLSDQGLSVRHATEEGKTIDDVFTKKDYEKKIFNTDTNLVMCKALINDGLYDPIAKNLGLSLFGKTIVFCVSQSHAARIANLLNQLAYEKWPELYGESDFAMQITSQVNDAQHMTINFANNRLSGISKILDGYETSKTRVAVTVGMMSTGYDCQDLLNIALMRPVFSPSDFVQIKGRGTRRFIFEYNNFSGDDPITKNKDKYKFFDFFATCEYFENDFVYDEKIKLPIASKPLVGEPIGDGGGDIIGDLPPGLDGPIDLGAQDQITTTVETEIGPEGMRIDREGFNKAISEDILGNAQLKSLWNNGEIQEAEDFVKKHVFDKPKYFLTLDKIRKIFGVDRRVLVREFLELAFGDRESIEMKDDLLESEWEKFMEVNPVDQDHYNVVKMFFKAYATDQTVRDIIQTRQTARFNTESSFTFDEYEKLNGFKTVVPQYINDYAYQLTNL